MTTIDKEVYIQCPNCNDLIDMDELEFNNPGEWLGGTEIECTICHESSLWVQWDLSHTRWRLQRDKEIET